MPVALEGLADLFTLLAWGIALSLLYIWRFTVGALIEHLANLLDKAAVHAFGRTIHFLGPVSAGLRDVDAAIQSTLAEIAHGAERATVYLFHKSLAGIELFGHELWSLGYDLGGALERIVHRTIPAEVRAATVALGHELHAIGRRLTAAELRAEHVIAHKLGAVEWELDRTEDFFRHGLGRVEGKLERLFRDGRLLRARVHEIEKLLAVAAFTGLLVKALERLGLRWLRCPSLGNIGRKTGCKGFKFLEDLLFGVIDVLLIADLCRITKALIEVAESSIVQDALRGFIDGIEHLLHCQNVTRPKVWHVHAAALPPAQAWSELPPVG